MNREYNEISFDDFLKVDIRVGTVVSVKINQKAKKPAYILKVDFGEDIGIKTSSAQITENYTIEDMQNKQVIAVVNFPEKRIAGIKSEVLVLAIVCHENGTVLLEPSKRVKNGTRML
jgi:tRNA-binding protein